MKCPRCQPENPPQAKSCLECGIADYGYALDMETISLAGDGQQVLRNNHVRRSFLRQR